MLLEGKAKNISPAGSLTPNLPPSFPLPLSLFPSLTDRCLRKISTARAECVCGRMRFMTTKISEEGEREGRKEGTDERRGG